MNKSYINIIKINTVIFQNKKNNIKPNAIYNFD